MRNWIGLIAGLAALGIGIGLHCVAEAAQTARSTGTDRQIGQYTFKPDEVYILRVAPFNISYIEFPRGERVTSIGAGDTESYEVNRLQSGRVVTIKPRLGETPRASMTVITTRNTYTFRMEPSRNPDLRVRFDHGPIGDPLQSRRRAFIDGTSGVQPTGQQRNTAYSQAGETDFAPVAVWDDGVHTYMQFSPIQKRPAVFGVRDGGKEETLNITQHPNHLIQVHATGAFFTLRIGDEALCIRNDAWPLSKPQSAENPASEGRDIPTGIKS